MSFAMDMGGGGGNNDGFFNGDAGGNPFEAPANYGGAAPMQPAQQQQQQNYFDNSGQGGYGGGGGFGGQQQSGFMQPGVPQGGGGYGNFGGDAVTGSMGSMGSMDSAAGGSGGGGGASFGGTEGFEEPPLLEELGIDFFQIQQKTLSVLNPMRQTDPQFMAEADLAGPLVFCMLFGATMLASGRIEFGYIYGVSILGTMGMYTILNLMSDHDINFGQVASILGYCLLPMVGLSALGIVFTLSTQLGGAVALLAIGWCAFSASKMFSVGLNMHGQQLLIGYPCMLLYGVFAMLAVF